MGRTWLELPPGEDVYPHLLEAKDDPVLVLYPEHVHVFWDRGNVCPTFRAKAPLMARVFRVDNPQGWHMHGPGTFPMPLRFGHGCGPAHAWAAGQQALADLCAYFYEHPDVRHVIVQLPAEGEPGTDPWMVASWREVLMAMARNGT